MNVHAASIEELLCLVARGMPHDDMPERRAAWDEVKERLAAAQRGCRRALDFRTATPEGLAIKADVRESLVRSGLPPGEWGTVGSD